MLLFGNNLHFASYYEIVGHKSRIIRNSVDILDDSDSRLFNFLFHMDQ